MPLFVCDRCGGIVDKVNKIFWWRRFGENVWQAGKLERQRFSACLFVCSHRVHCFLLCPVCFWNLNYSKSY